jgi:esterase/lipase superfamily enzyme
MLALSGLSIAALGVLAALIVYGLAWRATSGRSTPVQVLVRGGLLLLIAVPFASLLLLSPAMRGAYPESAPQMSSPLQDELLREADRDAQVRARSRPSDRLNGAPAEPGPGATAPQPGAGDPSRGYAAAPPATTTEKTTWDLVPVFFGTDREEQPDPKRLQFNSERGRRLELGQAMVTVPKSHEVPNIERPWVVKIPYFDVTIYEQAEDPDKHFTMQKINKLPEADFLKLARERIAASNRYKDHAIVFVHGYNTSFDHAIYRTAQIAYDLKFDGAAFLYSWPSGGAVASYTYDRESAQASEPYLRQFLDLVVKQTGAKSVSIIAHSMGNQPLLDVLKDMRSGGPESVVINEVILAAPDVDADNFANVAQRIDGIAKGVTLYAASNDRALIVSRNFWRNPRAGDVPASGPLIVPGIETIDVTAASTDSFALNHSGYAENNDLLQDIGKLILSGLRPPDQRLPALKRTPSPKGDYWRYAAP